ncbi:MAG: hypothetical protein ABI168_03500 [Ginsengibacter sp.]
MKLIPLLFTFVLFEVSCLNQAREKTMNEKYSTNGLSGTFTAVISWADCPGIDLTVFSNPDSSFSELMIYQERNCSFKDTGNDLRMISS